jgi:hypothetical protein
VTLTHGKTGQFDLLVDGKVLVTRGGNWLTRSLGAGYPDFERVVAELEKRTA